MLGGGGNEDSFWFIKFLGNRTHSDYKRVVRKHLQKFLIHKSLMSVKMLHLSSLSDYFPVKCVNYKMEKELGFYHDIQVMEECYL